MKRSNAEIFAEEAFAAGEETLRRLPSFPFLLICLVPLRMPITTQARLAMMALSILFFLQLVLA